MPAILHVNTVTSMLETAFGHTDNYNYAYSSIYQARLCKGIMPGSPSIETGVTYLSAAVSVINYFLYPNNGITRLAGNIPFTGTGLGPATFIRFFSPANYGVLDISIDTVASDTSALVDTVAVATNTIVRLMDLRIKVNNLNNFKVSNSISTYLLDKLIYDNTGYGPGYLTYLAACSKYNFVNMLYDKTVTMDIYSGPIPETADYPIEGVKLWSRASTSNSMFTINGGGMSLTAPLTANAIATGTPTFFRITKASFTGTDPNSALSTTSPTCTVQGAIGDVNGLLLSKYYFVTGISYTALGLAVTMQP